MPSGTSKPRVLVVDDERLVANTLALILNQSGWDATTYYDGESAVDAAATLKPVIVVSDVVMPGINGVEAGRRIQELVPDCRIILISGQASTQNFVRDAGLPEFAFEILTKPIHPKILLEHMRRVVPPT